MVYEIVWTSKATGSYVNNLTYLEAAWTTKELNKFIVAVERKLTILSLQPYIGRPRNSKNHNTRITIVNKRISLIYRVKVRNKRIELILFWNTYQDPVRL